ncbi:unnamed protein product [Parajaminaea phylloscopi]
MRPDGIPSWGLRDAPNPYHESGYRRAHFSSSPNLKPRDWHHTHIEGEPASCSMPESQSIYSASDSQHFTSWRSSLRATSSFQSSPLRPHAYPGQRQQSPPLDSRSLATEHGYARPEMSIAHRPVLPAVRNHDNHSDRQSERTDWRQNERGERTVEPRAGLPTESLPHRGERCFDERTHGAGGMPWKSRGGEMYEESRTYYDDRYD